MTKNDWQEKVIMHASQLHDQDIWEKEGWKLAMHKAYQDNLWFTPESSSHAIESIRQKFFEESKLRKWIRDAGSASDKRQKVGVICAGNLPMVAFHDILAVIMAGHDVKVKLSHKDKHLIPFVLDLLVKEDNSLRSHIEIVDKLRDFDAVIATGSDNSQRYFKYYFGQKPHLFRNNRTSVAVLTGEESEEELDGLADDILMYFGLGCRNVSRLFLPRGFDLDRIFKATLKYVNHAMHSKYKNNYQYQLAMLMMNKTEFLTNDLLILKESDNLHAPIAVLHYSYYDDLKEVDQLLDGQKDSIQCVMARADFGSQKTIAFGEGQKPELWNYADHIDTLAFLQNI